MGRYCVYYFLDYYDKMQPQFIYAPVLRGILYHSPSESCMFIPGSYAEMLEDYE